MKAHNFDTSGRSEGYAPNTEFDERWKEYVEDNYDLLWTVASDQLRQFTEKEYTAYPGVGAGDYEFAIAGHSGEWLVLTKVEGIGALQWPWMGPMVSDLQGWSDEDLVKFYKLVVQIDKDVENPEAAMAEGYSAHRAMMEEEWKAELRSSPSAQR
jgi:hypothetical protein